MAYRVAFAATARREIDALDPPVRERILRAVSRLALAPHATTNVKALKGGGYRLRVGDYRVLYETKDELLLILVVRIGHRREVYRRP